MLRLRFFTEALANTREPAVNISQREVVFHCSLGAQLEFSLGVLEKMQAGVGFAKVVVSQPLPLS
jgi:hypothetical protein